MKKEVMLIVILFLVSGCYVNNPSECKDNTDCVAGGCSGTVCSVKGNDVITTCEWTEEYGCYKYDKCSCVEGECAWEQTPAFFRCLEEVKGR